MRQTAPASPPLSRSVGWRRCVSDAVNKRICLGVGVSRLGLCRFSGRVFAVGRCGGWLLGSGRAGKMADRQIGILGMEVYFPTTFVEQADLGSSLLTMTGKETVRG